MTMKRPKNPLHDQSGVLAIMTILWVSILSLAALATVTLIASAGMQMTGSSYASERTFNAAEAGLNQGIYRLTYNAVPGTFCVDFSGVNKVCNAAGDTVTVTTSAVPSPGDPYERIVTAKAEDVTGKVRTVSLNAQTSTYVGSLNFAVQAGNGGIIFDNTSKIYGDVYSNGPIGPDGGGDAGQVYACVNTLASPQCSVHHPGNVTVAGMNSVKKTNVLNGSVKAYTIDSMSSIAQDAYYQTLIGTVRASGELCSTLSDGTHCHRNSGQQPVLPLPITDDPLDPNSPIPRWVAEVNDVSNPNTPLPVTPGNGCPNQKDVFTPKVDLRSNYYCVTGTTTLGRQRINASLYVANHSTLTLTGNVYVTGKVYIDGGATVEVLQDPSGMSSWSIISEGVISIDNGATLRGSGNIMSGLMIVSRSAATDGASGTDDPAIYASNNSQSVIFAAPKGMIKVKNNGELHATVANIIKMANQGKVYFDENLSAFVVPSPDSVPIGTVSGTWREL